jgi:hypothetical protein
MVYITKMKPEVLKQKHNEKLAAKGIPFVAIGKYDTSASTKPTQTSFSQLYRCPEGHEFTADRARTLRGITKCPDCGHGQRRRTPLGYENELFEMEAPLWPLEDYRGTNIKINHECVKGHVVSIVPQSVLRGTGCPVCSGMAKYTPETYLARLIDKGITHRPLEDLNGVMNKILHRCGECNHEWRILPHEILKGTGCPVCAKMGINRSKPAVLYYVRLDDGTHIYYKIGVTTKSVEQRLANYKLDKKILLEKHYTTGAEALAAEQMILEEYAESKIYAPQFISSGYTELFQHDVLLLDKDRRDEI